MSIAADAISAVFQKLDRDLSKLSSKSEPQSVHRLRTGTRRLQILLDDLSSTSGRNQKKLMKLLNRLRKRAGKMRDLDVQMTALRSLKLPREPRRKTQLMNELIELRGRQEKKLRKAADKETLREIRQRLRRARKDFNPNAGLNPLIVAQSMLKGIDQQNSPITEEILHRYRIITKRSRYAAEFATQSNEKTKFIARLKRVQDALGDWHDWLTLTQTASDCLGEVRESPLVAELHNVTGAKFRHAVAMLLQIQVKAAPDVAHPVSAVPRSPSKTLHDSAAAA